MSTGFWPSMRTTRPLCHAVLSLHMKYPWLAASILVLPSITAAATRTVGPGKQYASPCEAIAAAQPGDEIAVDPITYGNNSCQWSTDNLHIYGVGGRAKMDVTGTPVSNDKGIFVVLAPSVVIENFEFMGATSSSANGAGIRHQGLNLTVRNCFFHNNENGILGSPIANGQAVSNQGTVLVESSEFANNGAGDGQSHNMYMGPYAQFTLRYSYSHNARIGHLVKSRSFVNTIEYNRLTDQDGTASYEIDLPNGGDSAILGNLIQQSATTDNSTMIEFGGEGLTAGAKHRLLVLNNTVVNDRGNGGNLTTVAAGSPTVRIKNNLVIGRLNLSNQATASLISNWTMADGDPLLVDRASYSYDLQSGSPVIDRAQPNLSDEPPAVEMYKHPLSHVSRITVGNQSDIGAYEFGHLPFPDDVVPDGERDGVTTSGKSGCGCDSNSPTSIGALFAIGIVALGYRRQH
jgi:hypothetical protein